MSFRYASALPTCLHGRSTTRSSALLSSLSSCRRCNTGFAHVAAEHYDAYRDRQNVDSDVERNRKTSLHAKSEKKGAALSSEQTFGHNAAPQGIPKTAKPSVQSVPDLKFRTRIGTALEVPAFTTDHEHSRGAVITRVKNSEGFVSPKVEARESKGSYREWEELHDRFLEVRRTRPAETREAFKEQMMFARQFLGDITTEASTIEFKRKWSTLENGEQSRVLPILLIGSLAESAAKTLFVLSNIRKMPYSFLIRMNCMRSTGLMYRKEIQENSELKELYETLVEKLRSPDAWPAKKLPIVLLQTLLFWSTPEQCQKIIRDFSTKYPEMESSATTTIIDHYLRIEDREQAFEYFQRLPEKSLREPDAIITGLRDRLLKLDYVAENETGANFKYLPKILALGIPSDEALHNTVIESAIINKMHDVAWDVYQYLESSKFQSNARSHLILLRDSFLRGDLERVNLLMTKMNGRKDLLSNQYLLAYSMNIVRNISCYEKHLGPTEAHTHVMALYDRAYDRSPLVRLGIVQPADNISTLQQPSPTLLAFTIWTHVLIQRRDREVHALWEWVKHLIANGDTAIMQAAGYDVIYNGLILYYARKLGTLFRSLDVVHYMLSGNLCLPTSRTWSLILCAFLRHGQITQAEKIVALMQARGHRVEAIVEQYGDYVPVGCDLEALAANTGRHLDERSVPQGLEGMMADVQPPNKEKVNTL